MEITVDGEKKEVAIHPKYDFYSASADGVIYFRPALRGSTRTGKPLPRSDIWEKVHTFPVHAPYTPSYLRFRISCGKVQKMPTVHRFVLECFRGIKPSHIISRHLDGNHLKNRLDNLAYGTTQENVNDAISHIGKYFEGIRNGRAKLLECDILEIRSLFAQGATLSDLHLKYPQVSKENLSMIVRRKTWAHLS